MDLDVTKLGESGWSIRTGSREYAFLRVDDGWTQAMVDSVADAMDKACQSDATTQWEDGYQTGKEEARKGLTRNELEILLEELGE